MSAEEKVTLLSKLPRAQDRAHRLDFRRLLLGLHSREDTRCTCLLPRTLPKFDSVPMLDTSPLG